SSLFAYSRCLQRNLHSFPTRRSSDLFIESENNESLAGPYHGNEGNQYVSENRYRHPLSLAFIRAGQELGYPYTNDFNGKDEDAVDRKSTRLNSSHVSISYAVFCLKKK